MSGRSEDGKATKGGADLGASTRGPVVVIVRDGWGRNPNPDQDAYNAIKLAKTPVCDALLRDYPWTLIKTSGEDVGLPDGTMGNSEVGHQNIGAGRIVYQESVRITKAIREGDLFRNAVLLDAIARAKSRDRAVHLLGIASDAGVHGLIQHLYGCLELCQREGQTRVYLHLFTDGRDTGPFTGADFVAAIAEHCRERGVGQIATLCGRYWAMDRDHRWERVRRAYDALTGRSEVPNFADPVAAVRAYYSESAGSNLAGDEFVTPRTVGDASGTRIQDGDTVVFYNYRGDRPREITRAFVMPEFLGHVAPSPDSGERGFDRGPLLDLAFVTLTAYEKELNTWVKVAFPKPPKMTDIGGEYLSKLGLRQFRCAETEKFPHVTFFFNDYRDEPFPGESREMAQSPKVATYDQQPEMSARQVCDLALARLRAHDPEDFILINFANTDMVGHTGVLPAAIRAAETVDALVGELVAATLARGGALIVTADHGNSEQMWDPITQAPHTAHTTYDVECILVADGLRAHATGSPDTPSPALRANGRLADIFPTVLHLMGLEAPAAMSGRTLFQDP